MRSCTAAHAAAFATGKSKGKKAFVLKSVTDTDHSATKGLVAEERLSNNDQSDVIYRFKKPWDDGTTAMKLTPMDLMERLVALVPRPRVHLTRYHGVLGPHYKHRKK